MHERLKKIKNIKALRKQYEEDLNPFILLLVRRVKSSVILFIDEYSVSQKAALYTSIGADIFYMSPKNVLFNYSGKASKAALELTVNNRTKEHFHVRKLCAEKVVKKIIENKEKCEEELVNIITTEYIDVCGQYHYTTSSENNDLKPNQTAENHTSAYKDLGIDPIDDEKWIEANLKNEHKLKLN